MKFLPYLFALLTCQIIFGQTDTDENKDKISKVLENYFELEREAIHLHVDKTTFLTNESIWYQGYILDRKTNKPFFTSNVFVLLYDEKGNKLSEKLIYANNGTFSGKIELKESFHSGIYYIQAYTNWMNNFTENENTLQKVTIINPKEGAKNHKKVNTKTLELTINPEGGNLILGIPNSVGVQIKDCRGNAPANCEVLLQTNSGEILSSTKLNAFGYGKFEFTPLNNNYKVVVNHENGTLSKPMPTTDVAGFAIKVNNATMAGKTLINLKANAATLNSLSSRKLYLVVHQDQKASINEITFNESSLEQTFTIPSSALSPGINTIRIIDSDLKEHASRLIYIYPKIEKSMTFSKIPQGNQKVKLTGQSKYVNAIFSSSFLPEQSIAWDDSNNIFTGITINPYLFENLPHANYYFNNPNRMQFYELDLALLNQPKKKYNWEYMKMTKPAIKYSFDIGLDIKGKINPAIKNKLLHKIKLISYKNLLWLNGDVNENGEYNLEHVLMPDSTFVEMSLLKLPDFSEVNSKLAPEIANRKKPFLQGFKINIPDNCDDDLETIDLDFLQYIDKKSIILREIQVENNQPRLRYANQLGNGNLRGYKIEQKHDTQSLLQFIKFAGGFEVNENPGEAAIYSKNRHSFNGEQSSPAIFIDGRQIMNITEIESMLLNEVDEVFMNPHAIYPSLKNFQGIIRIYRKKLSFTPNEKSEKPNAFYIADGFSRQENFVNSDYGSVGIQGFNSLGLLNWSQKILTDEEGSFSIDLQMTNFSNQKGKTIVQGMTNDGILFQEEVMIDL